MIVTGLKGAQHEGRTTPQTGMALRRCALAQQKKTHGLKMSEGGGGRCCEAHSPVHAASSVCLGFFLDLFLPHRSGVGHLVCETFLCAVAEACKSQRLREEKAAVGIIPRS